MTPAPSGLLPVPVDVPEVDDDPEAVAASGHRLLVASAVLDRVEGGVEPVAPGWAGSAASAQATAAARLRGRAGALALAQRQVAVGLVKHAAALLPLLAERRDLAARRTSLLAGRAALAEAIASGAPDAGVPARAAALRTRVQAHDAAVAAWWRRVEAARAEVVAACRAAGAGPTGDRVRGVDAHARAWVGAPDPADAALAALVGVTGAGLLPGSEDDGSAARTWWAALDDDTRWAVLAAAPGVVGTLDGLPASVRDRANRLSVALDLARLGALAAAGLLGRQDRGRLERARAAGEALRRAGSRRDPRSGVAVAAVLWDYDPRAHDGDGRVALAYGDPDAAAHVAVLVPGLGTDGDSVVAKGEDAWAVFSAARGATADSVAAMTWIGYDAPSTWASGDLDAWAVTGDGLARDGGRELSRDLESLVATRGTDPHLTVVGHSYGSTTVAHGAVGPGLPADDVVLLGSPGAGPAGRAADLGVGDRVWVGSASSDPVTRLGDQGWVGVVGGLGTDPASEEFGARRFRAEHPDRDEGLRWSLDQHRGYLAAGGESLAAVALVVSGRPDDVAPAAPRRDPWWGPVRDPEAGRVL